MFKTENRKIGTIPNILTFCKLRYYTPPTMTLDIEALARRFGSRGLKGIEADLLVVSEKAEAEGAPETFREEDQRKLETPEGVTEYWRRIWASWGNKVGKSFRIPPLTIDRSRLRAHYVFGKKIVYVPQEVAIPDGLNMLGRIFPEMQLGPDVARMFVSAQPGAGYLAIVDSITPRSVYEEGPARGIGLPTYIVASQDSKLNTGRYFDEPSDEKLPWTIITGSVVLRGSRYPEDPIASFNRDGRISLGFLSSRFRELHRNMGIRTEVPIDQSS